MEPVYLSVLIPDIFRLLTSNPGSETLLLGSNALGVPHFRGSGCLL